MSRFVFLVNGPPRAGKDTFGTMLLSNSPRPTYHAKMSKLLKERTHALYGVPCTQHDVFEGGKDEPSEWFFGLTPRQAYIAVSERLLKPMHGNEVLGRLLVADIEANGSEAGVVVVTDSGFAAEAQPVIAAFGAENCALVRLHRPGCTFDGDSRSYIELEGVRTFDIQNVASLDMLEHGARQVLWECGIKPRKAA